MSELNHHSLKFFIYLDANDLWQQSSRLSFLHQSRKVGRQEFA